MNYNKLAMNDLTSAVRNLSNNKLIEFKLKNGKFIYVTWSIFCAELCLTNENIKFGKFHKPEEITFLSQHKCELCSSMLIVFTTNIAPVIII